MTTDAGRIGIICPPDHAVFGDVAERLRERGHEVVFLEPGVELPEATLDDLDVLVNKKVRWESLHALEYAHRNGIPAWNDYVATTLLLSRLSQLRALEVAGFRVPDVLPEKPTGGYVAKGFVEIDDDPTLNGEGEFYQPLLETTGVDHKYYAVHDGDELRAAVVRFESKLHGERERRGVEEPKPWVLDRIERLRSFVGARAFGVDLVEPTDGSELVAVDVNPATSFRHTGLEDALADSIETSL
jgi:hypothetical protein